MNWDAIRASHPIAEIIGQAVNLEKSGNEYKGCCPFHDEKTPSFHVVPDKDFYHCFGCGAHGDVVDFIEHFQGCNTGEAINLLTGGNNLEQSDADKDQRKAILEQREKEQAENRAAAIKRAAGLWEGADRADPHHPYLIRKNVEAHSLRQTQDGKLMLPIFNAQGEIQSIQTIDDGGGKKFLPDAPTSLGRMMIGVSMGRAIICEGYATGATLFDAVPDQIVVSYSCANMEKIAREKHALGHSFILAADTGVSASKMTALGIELDVPVVIPRSDIPNGGTDFNDQAAAFGTDDVSKAFRNAMKAFTEKKNARDKAIEQEIGPVDLWAAPPVPELPRGLLPPLIERYAFDCATQMGTDPAGFAMSALACCAAVIHDDHKLKPKLHENWTESARIWTMLIGAPSTRKSPMMAKTASRIKKLDAIQLGENNRALADWQEQGGAKGGEKKPLSPRMRIEDATTEAAQEVCKESPAGILLLQDELSGFFGRIEKYGGKGGGADRSFWLQAYGGGQYAVNRVGRGAFLIDNLSVTMLGGIQPEKVIEVTQGSGDDGLIQRFIPVLLRPASRDKDVPVPAVAEEFDELIEALRNKKPFENFFGVQPYTLSEGARRIREESADRHFRIVQTFEGFNTKLSTHIGKYDGLFVRLCLLWHIIENVCQELPQEVSEATARRVAAFMGDFIMRHAMSFYIGLLGLSDNQENVRAVGGYILAHKCETITMRDMVRGIRQMRAAPDWERERITGSLEAFGWIEPTLNRSGLTTWKVDPEVHIKFANMAENEKLRRNQVRAMILEEAKIGQASE